MGMRFSPHEANPPLIVDADGMLTSAIALERLEHPEHHASTQFGVSGCEACAE
jgi:hypothetical protein